MSVQWFPGHMMKAVRMMEENIRLADCVLCVLDARIPRSCLNPDFDAVFGSKPIVYLLNKSDLADPAETEQWRRVLGTERTAALSATANRAVKDVTRLVEAACRAKTDAKRAKGITYVPRAMVTGVPNTGKSTVINMLCGKGKTITGDRPGVTKGKQWVRVDGVVDLLDTPGTLPKRIDDETAGIHLAIVGSVRDEVTDTADLAVRLIRELTLNFPGTLSARYGIEESEDAFGSLCGIARGRGFLLRGGEFDWERAAAALLDDFRKGRLGRFTLEKAQCSITKETFPNTP